MTDVLLYDALPDTLRTAIDHAYDRTLCPKCDGGRSRERSLSIRQSEDGVLKLKCFRASCGWFALSMTDPDARLQTKRLKPPSVYRDEIRSLATATDLTLCHKIRSDYSCNLGLAIDHGWGQNERGDTLIMPVRSPYGEVRGHVTRTFDMPKRCYTYKATAQPWLDHWTMGDMRSETTVIVEDCISALRLSGLGYNAAALLGTSITTEQAKEIQACYGQRPIYLALDRDAFEKALHLTKRHAHILKMRPVCLDEDIKQMEHDAAIHKLFEG